MFMPALALAIPLVAIIAQLLKQSLKETIHLDYVPLARTKGYGKNHVIVKEALPNALLPTICVLLTLEMGIAVIVETILSFVNLSISTDQPTWGGMLSEGRLSIHQAWWVLV